MKRLRGYLNSLDQFISRKTGMRIILGLIVLFNIAVYIGTEYQAIPPYLQSRQDASGFSHKYAHKFAYFHYYTGDFPLLT